MQKNLIIAPHFDDEILGIGGTISKFEKEQDFYVCIVTNGFLGNPKIYNKLNFEENKNITKKIKKLVNIKKYFFLNLPATKLDQLPLSKISDLVINIANIVKPSKLYIPSSKDMHIDHRVIHEACLVACRPLYQYKINTVLAYEVLSETEWGSELGNSFKPNFYQELSEKDINMKIKLFKLYKNEVKKFPHPRSEQGIKNLSSMRGQYINYNHAEAFELIKHISH
jgi:N-acetylglucosamine malate deacetylase 1